MLVPDALDLVAQWNEEPPADEAMLCIAARLGAWKPKPKLSTRAQLEAFVANARKCGVM